MTPAVFLAAAAVTPWVVDRRLEPPPERQDRRVYYSAPYSLHLDASTGSHYFSFAARRVEPHTRYRLRLRYLIALDTPGTPAVELALHHDSPADWRSLPDAGFAVPLTVLGRWTLIDRTFVTHPDANSAALYLSLDGRFDVGEFWIDDIILSPVGQPVTVGP